jgi:hypothetical protein
VRLTLHRGSRVSTPRGVGTVTKVYTSKRPRGGWVDPNQHHGKRRVIVKLDGRKGEFAHLDFGADYVTEI